MFIILKKGHQPGVYVPLRALFLVSSTISQGLLYLEFRNLVQTSDMTSCTVYKKSATYYLSVPLFVPKWGGGGGNVSFANFLLYFSEHFSLSFTTDIANLYYFPRK